MMRKNVLALSVAAMIGGLGMAGSASAVVVVGTGPAVPVAADTLVAAPTGTILEFNPGGTGHILLVPYFTTQNGNATLLNIVNTDTLNGKAVKVRFRGASNSDDIFDFQLYLSPGDIWAANVFQGPDGRSMLRTDDNSCTIPSNINAAFVAERLPASFTAAARANETREGYIEIFNMADIPPFTGDATKVDTLYDAIKHTSTGTVACGTELESRVATLLVDEKDADTRGFEAPTSGLMSNWTIINVPQAAAYSGQAAAIEARVGAGGVAGTGNVVFFPQTGDDPAAGAGAVVVAQVTADPGFRDIADANIDHETAAVVAGIAVTIANYDLPDLSTPYVTAPAVGAPEIQAGLLSDSIAKTLVMNEFLTEATIAAATDFTFSMPTRRYSMVVDYRAGANTLFKRIYNNTVLSAGGLRYFTPANTEMSAHQACVKLAAGSIGVWDRSERKLGGTSFVISPGSGPTALTLCGETSVLSWNAGGVSGASTLGATVARKDIDAAPFKDGWAVIGLDPVDAADAGTLPVIGSAFIKATNPGVLTGVSGNFGVNFDHRFKR